MRVLTVGLLAIKIIVFRMWRNVVWYKFTLGVYPLLQELVRRPTGYTTWCLEPRSNHTPRYIYPLQFPGGGEIPDSFSSWNSFLLAALPARCGPVHHCLHLVRSHSGPSSVPTWKNLTLSVRLKANSYIPRRAVFLKIRLCLSHLNNTVRPYFIHTYHTVPLLCFDYVAL